MEKSRSIQLAAGELRSVVMFDVYDKIVGVLCVLVVLFAAVSECFRHPASFFLRGDRNSCPSCDALCDFFLFLWNQESGLCE